MPALCHHASSSPSGSNSRLCCPNSRRAIRSVATLRRRRDEWIEGGLMDALDGIAAYDRIIGLELADVCVDGCITKAPCGGQKAGKSPVDRGKRGIKRSTMVDAKGIPLGVLTAPAKAATTRRFWAPPLRLSPICPSKLESISIGLIDSEVSRRLLEERGLVGVIPEKGNRAPLKAGLRWVEMTNSWHNAHKKLVYGEGRMGHRLLDCVIQRDHRSTQTHPGSLESRYRWETRPPRP